MENNIYFKLGTGIVDFAEPLSDLWFRLGETWEDYFEDKWIPLSEELKEFYAQNPTASAEEVWNMLLNPGPTEEQLLEYAKQNKLMEIDNYDRGDDVNSFTIGGKKMWLSFEDRSRLLASVQAYETMGQEQMTKWFDGLQFTFPLTTWKQMIAALEVYASEALNVTEQHKAAVNSLNDIQDVENYDITSGYPEKLQF